MGKLRKFESATTEEKDALLRAALMVDNNHGNYGGRSPEIWKVAQKVLEQASEPYTLDEIDEFAISTDDTDWFKRMLKVNEKINNQNADIRTIPGY